MHATWLAVRDLGGWIIAAILLSFGIASLLATIVLNSLIVSREALVIARRELATAQNDLVAVRSELEATRRDLKETQLILTKMPAPVSLENLSTGKAYFYADGELVCVNGCTIAFRLETGPHTLSAFTYYGTNSNPYVTPQARIEEFHAGAVFRYLACGQLGNPGTNCGLFGTP